jgi:signal transduction histidine kinase
MVKNNNRVRERSRFSGWFHRTFDDWAFRSLIGPAQVDKAVDGSGQEAREEWKRDLEHRRRYTREQHERERLAREAERGD